LKFSQKMLRNYQLINKLRGKNEMSLKNSIQFENFSSQIRSFSFRTNFHRRSGCIAQKHTFFVCGYNHRHTLQFTSFSTKPTKQGKKATQVRVKNQIEVEVHSLRSKLKSDPKYNILCDRKKLDKREADGSFVPQIISLPDLPGVNAPKVLSPHLHGNSFC